MTKHSTRSASGPLGRKSFAAREDDEVTVQAELSEPAYSYLIAFRPDGTDELCDPEDEDTPPPRKHEPLYPPPAKSDERYRLSEGAGLYAFALVVSRAAAALVSRVEEAHRADGVVRGAAVRAWGRLARRRPGSSALLADDTAGTRGKGVKARGSGASGREAGELAARPAGRRCRDPRSVPGRAGLRAVTVASAVS